MKVGIRVIITQETDETSHMLYEVFNVKEFPKQYSNKDVERVNAIKTAAEKLTNEF